MIGARPIHLIKNYFILSGGELLSKVLTLAAVVYLARVLGPIVYGTVEFASAVLLCAGLVVDQGLGLYGAREIAKAPARMNELVSNIILLRTILAVLTFGGVVLFALALQRSAGETRLLVIFALSLLVLPLLIPWAYQAHNRMGFVTAMQVIRQATYAVVVFGLVRFAAQAWLVGIAEFAGVCLAAGFGLLMYRPALQGSLATRPALSLSLIRESLPIGLSQAFWMLRTFGATVLVGIIATPLATGYFGAAMRLMVALHAFVYLYYFNLLPTMTQAWQKMDGSYSLLIARSLRLVAPSAILCGALGIWLAPKIMTLIYGPAFAPATAALRWMIAALAIAAIDGHYRFGLLASGQQQIEMAIAALGAVIALLAIPLGYLLAGVSGAALGIFISELVVWMSAWAIARRKLVNRRLGSISTTA